MPWGKRTENGKTCVYKKSTGKTLHCYDSDSEADAYLKALYANAPKSEKDYQPGVYITKEDDGRYNIIAVSTAAIRDQEGETFDIDAMDYEIEQANETSVYPEFRVFHSPALGIGKVEKMSRVGIFAVDEGHSYTDPFSIDVCEKMLTDNNGKWRVSRGFYVYEASGGCPRCNENLVVKSKHMVAGFYCPKCKSLHPQHKVLKDLHFRKTRTFDVTVTDKPSVPYTGVAAFKPINQTEEFIMNKKDLAKRLKDAGLDETLIAERLESVDEAKLKEFDDLPFAEVLKEFKPVAAEPEEETFVLDDSVLDEFTTRIKAVVKEALDGLEIDVPEMEIKESPEIAALKEQVAELADLVKQLVKTDEVKIKEKVAEVPRNGKLRIVRRLKQTKPATDEGVDDEDVAEGEEEMPPEMLKKMGKKVAKEAAGGAVIASGDGEQFTSMSEFIGGVK
jgi:hypothetical protein